MLKAFLLLLAAFIVAALGHGLLQELGVNDVLRYILVFTITFPFCSAAINSFLEGLYTP